MKKFLIILSIILAVNISCKKINPLCACSPMPATSFNLVIKDANGNDLLNSSTPGFIAQNKIQLYSIDGNSVVKQISFSIRQPYVSGTSRFEYNQLSSEEIALKVKDTNSNFYLKLGDDKLVQINLIVSSNIVDKAYLNKIEAPIETTPFKGFSRDPIFILKF